jgi:hypothetical protein
MTPVACHAHEQQFKPGSLPSSDPQILATITLIFLLNQLLTLFTLACCLASNSNQTWEDEIYVYLLTLFTHF